MEASLLMVAFVLNPAKSVPNQSSHFLSYQVANNYTYV